MRHAIIGNGNLGNSLATKLLKDNHIVKLFSTFNGWKYPTNLQAIHDFIPDHIWVTVGAGSVEQAKANYLPFLDLHVRLPADLAKNVNPGACLHVFSSDYVLDNPVKSLYALSKLYMEETLTRMDRPKTYIYRVGSLYGTYKPNKCFPYKLKKNWVESQKKEGEITLPSNHITPTPTDWLAGILVSALDSLDASCRIFNVAPSDCCKVQEWGELILNQPVKEKDLDPNRPAYSNIGCNLPLQTSKSWLDLWKEREITWQDILNKIE